jgi:hypothetical protein
LNNSSAYITPDTAIPSSVVQYTPLRFAASADFPYQYPPVPSYAAAPPSKAEKFENIPSAVVAKRCQTESASKKKTHYDERDPTAVGKRQRVDNAPARRSPYTAQYRAMFELEHNTVQQAAPMRYNPVTGPFKTVDQRHATPTAQSSPIASRAPSLPGAERYLQQRHNKSAPPQYSAIPPDQSFRAQAQMPSEHSAPPPQGQKRRGTDPAEAHHTSHNLYPALPEQSAPPGGTQHNPFEIPSSPERAPKSRSSKKKKKKFYAVAAGHAPGIYTNWNEVEEQIKGYSGVKHRGFATEAEARSWFEQHSVIPDPRARPIESFPSAVHRREVSVPFHGVQAEQTLEAMDRRYEQLNAAPPDFTPPTSSQATAMQSAAPTSVDPEPVLKAEQQKVVDLILQGHNVFYTGSAGCGKSTILKAFVKQLQVRGKSVKIVAPTNLAALNVGGVTTWNFAGWTPDSLKKPLDKLMQAAHGNEVWERFDKVDVLVIDEISMVENLLFERLNYIMKASRGEKYGGGPFGGVQIVVTGDVSLYRSASALRLTCLVLSTVACEAVPALYWMRLGADPR